LPHEGRIELVPRRSIHETRGFLAGIDTGVPADDERL